VLVSFLADAGFTIQDQFGDWDRRPLTATSPGDHHPGPADQLTDGIALGLRSSSEATEESPP
jgi:hypothetical protein